jgi:lipoprotein-releasing system permease protein
LNYELFIAKRLIANKKSKNSISSSIIKIAIVSIAVSMIVMILSISTGVGLKNKIKEKLSGLNGHIVINKFDVNNGVNSIKPINKNQDFYPNFKNVSGIRHVQTFATKTGIIRTEKDFELAVFKGVDADYDWSFFKEYLAEGVVPKIKEKQVNTVIISKTMSERLDLHLGDKFNMWFIKNMNTEMNDFAAKGIKSNTKGRALTVVGIYNSGVLEFDKLFIIGDIKLVQRLNKWTKDQVQGFEIFIDNFDNLPLKEEEVYENIDPSLNSISIADKDANLFEWLDMFDINIRLIIIIMIIIAGINMITALLVLILERTQMIGILKALGNTNRSIQKIFLYNAAYLIIKGLFWGNLIGIGLLLIQQYFGVVTLDPENYYVSKAPVYINLGYILLLNFGTLILCLLMLIVPTYMVSKINPVKAIKFV